MEISILFWYVKDEKLLDIQMKTSSIELKKLV